MVIKRPTKTIVQQKKPSKYRELKIAIRLPILYIYVTLCLILFSTNWYIRTTSCIHVLSFVSVYLLFTWSKISYSSVIVDLYDIYVYILYVTYLQYTWFLTLLVLNLKGKKILKIMQPYQSVGVYLHSVTSSRVYQCLGFNFRLLNWYYCLCSCMDHRTFN